MKIGHLVTLTKSTTVYTPIILYLVSPLGSLCSSYCSVYFTMCLHQFTLSFLSCRTQWIMLTLKKCQNLRLKLGLFLIHYAFLWWVTEAFPLALLTTGPGQQGSGQHLTHALTNHSPQATYNMLSVFVNTLLLGFSHTHLFTYSFWLILTKTAQ